MSVKDNFGEAKHAAELIRCLAEKSFLGHLGGSGSDAMAARDSAYSQMERLIERCRSFGTFSPEIDLASQALLEAVRAPQPEKSVWVQEWGMRFRPLASKLVVALEQFGKEMGF